MRKAGAALRNGLILAGTLIGLIIVVILLANTFGG